MPKAAINSTSPFGNYSTAQLADELGQVKAEAAEIETREKALKAELVARQISAAEGTLFRVTVSESLRQSLDAEAIKSEMGERWCAIHSKVAVVTAVRVTARTGSAKAA